MSLMFEELQLFFGNDPILYTHQCTKKRRAGNFILKTSEGKTQVILLVIYSWAQGACTFLRGQLMIHGRNSWSDK